MHPWGFPISTQAGPIRPYKGRKRVSSADRAFSGGKGKPQNPYRQETWQSTGLFQPRVANPNSSVFSSPCTSRAEAAWLKMSVLTTTLQAPCPSLQTSLTLPLLSSDSVQEGPPQRPFTHLPPPSGSSCMEVCYSQGECIVL